jgi:hypothetical protein
MIPAMGLFMSILGTEYWMIPENCFLLSPLIGMSKLVKSSPETHAKGSGFNAL